MRAPLVLAWCYSYTFVFQSKHLHQYTVYFIHKVPVQREHCFSFARQAVTKCSIFTKSRRVWCPHTVLLYLYLIQQVNAPCWCASHIDRRDIEFSHFPPHIYIHRFAQTAWNNTLLDPLLDTVAHEIPWVTWFLQRIRQTLDHVHTKTFPTYYT
jgi:predicted nucleotidyltransferase